jgi:hypothetical protein
MLSKLTRQARVLRQITHAVGAMSSRYNTPEVLMRTTSDNTVSACLVTTTGGQYEVIFTAQGHSSVSDALDALHALVRDALRRSQTHLESGDEA